ncbi:hypothetical protein ASE80_16830 [Pseudomonas sp. Leaf15]|uniref:hypothetical protein n=1 Tax=unclassified Pseudomonas TaxID=196821 RepID=UPI0007038CAC|nr:MULTISPECIES: hypothetical protein [unclassified Pseudomonas]KQM46420.1 hypothetical protein ASE80_16830 [Pseudomonas sp. Leaf15]RAH01649.1 hypothetical protein DJ480_16750 [Pseudomonas sp. Leaf98]
MSSNNTTEALEKIVTAILESLKAKGHSISDIEKKALLSINRKIHSYGDANQISQQERDLADEVERIFRAV